MVFSRSPKILKGAFVQYDGQFSQGRAIVFQYNPDKIYRKLEVCTEESFGLIRRNHIEPTRSPKEIITFTITLDAIDDLEHPDEHPNAVAFGVYPALSAIEILLYKQNSGWNYRRFLRFIWPMPANKRPLTLLIWGDKRIMPILVTDLHITEEMFDTSLNPVRVNIDVTMRILNEVDLPRAHKGYKVWESHLASKIAMAQTVYTDAQQAGEKGQA